MTRLVLKYIHEFRDRHGKTRRYFRRPGFKRVPLPGTPGSEQFMAAYQAALGGVSAPKLEIGHGRVKPGTIAALVVRYYRSTQFLSMTHSTQATYRGIIERFRTAHGEKRVATLRREDIKRMHEAKAGTPAAANNWLKLVRILLDLAVEEGLREDNPARTVKAIRHHTAGHEPWTSTEIEAFRAHHPLGTRARLAMELLYGTAQRRSDVVVLGRQLLRDGFLTFRQQKTHFEMFIPVLPELRAAIDAVPNNHLTFLVTEGGKPFTAAGFGNWFRDICEAAGLPKGFSAHGLRKAAATRLAEAGASDHEIMAWGGWKTLKEVQRYTASANRKKLAQSGADKLATGTSFGKPR